MSTEPTRQVMAEKVVKLTPVERLTKAGNDLAAARRKLDIAQTEYEEADQKWLDAYHAVSAEANS